MKARIIYREDGGVSIIHPVSKSQHEGESEQGWLKRIFDKATPEGASFKDVDLDKEQLPDRNFRGAWVKGTNGKAVDVCPIKKAAILDKKTEIEKESLIQAKMRSIAIAELTKEGKLTSGGKLVE